MSEHHIALTGHRPNKLGGYNINTSPYNKLRQDLVEYIQLKLKALPNAIIHCHSGLALGADTIWAQAIIKAKADYPDHIVFHAHIPSKNQASPWPPHAQKLWSELCNAADHTVFYDHDLPENPNKHQIVNTLFARNTGMINAADTVLAIYDDNGSNSGTAHAVNQAKKANKNVIVVPPSTYF